MDHRMTSYFPDGRPEDFEAVEIGSVTMVGHNHFEPPPWKSGNCFDVVDAKGHSWRTLNFYYENLEALLNLEGPVWWPLRCLVIRPGGTNHRGLAVIHDPRIPPPWYRRDWCQTCCPDHLLPMPQRLAGLLRIDCGNEVQHPPTERTEPKEGELPTMDLTVVSTYCGTDNDGPNGFSKRQAAGTLFMPKLAELIPGVRAAEEKLNAAARHVDRVPQPEVLAMTQRLHDLYAAYAREIGAEQEQVAKAVRHAERWITNTVRGHGFRIHDHWADRIRRACLSGCCP
jgi:hypothetical protein